MRKFTVIATKVFEADTAEEAALFMYQELTKGPAPLHYLVTDEARIASSLTLDREKADEFASVDHTADPGNW
ncbi:hypothetical protein [Sinorhizobium fredii]|uniref:Uncharacterized protein n=2 Tax=Rhizobium fredii TaxID=380 RepID=A0A2A6LT02_RHIFR|nr:hypothetical protein [Sinorhizobium fredii]AWI60564.1 hypothetical protein AB395_00005387 [Sinorhizobium fredii CCBAU 45436]PDT45681.1 hypothetical protein CO661_22395 [Sinorhizobium fredii]WOS66667.1 hypothetical protein SFGR64A_23690 [Sinorhizobium fredii GR64]CCF00026.1 hypothetical protein predicted by Glimmer/Critica [Sinorhizobium fredii HH103]